MRAILKTGHREPFPVLRFPTLRRGTWSGQFSIVPAMAPRRWLQKPATRHGQIHGAITSAALEPGIGTAAIRLPQVQQFRLSEDTPVRHPPTARSRESFPSV